MLTRQARLWIWVAMVGTLIAGLGLLPAFARDTTNPGSGYINQQTMGVFIRSHRVDISISNQIARTRIEQVFVNEGSLPAEGTYVFPLPQGVTISDLIVRIDGQVFHARVLEKEEAKRVYTGIVQQMRDPALLEYIGTNAIQASIFPIPPGGERTLEIEYSQVLTVEAGLVHYVYPLRMNHVSRLPVGNLSIHVAVDSNDPISTIYSPTHPVAIDRQSDMKFVAGFETSNTLEANDFSLYYGLADDDISLNLLSYRESAAEDGFFLALIAPPFKIDRERVIAKDVILVLDQSGSMQGIKWEQARDAAQFVLEHLNPEDRFNVIVFSTGVRPYAIGLQPASAAPDARAWLETLYSEGGTNIDEALRVALEQNDREHQSIVIFLTDGQPTEGITDLPGILSNVEARTGSNVRFFTFGVGDDVNTFLLDELGQRYHGTSAYVRPGEDIEAAVSSWYRKISEPVLTNLMLSFEGITVYDVYPAPDHMPDLFAGSQLMVVGRYHRETDDITLHLSGKVEDQFQTFTYSDLEFRSNAGGDALIPRLWATRRIGDLMNAIRLNGENPELVDSIVRLSIRYGIVTPYTSFIITEQDIFTEDGVSQAVAIMQPTATAMAAIYSGSSAINVAQQSGNMANSAMVATLPPDAVFLTNGTPVPGNFSVGGTALPTGTATVTSTPTAAAGYLMNGTPVPAKCDVCGTATVVPATTESPSLAAYSSSPSQGEPMQTVRPVGDRTFVWRDGAWIDTTFDPDTMTPERIIFLSEAYFALLDQDERVADYYALGEHVIFVLDGLAYEVVPD